MMRGFDVLLLGAADCARDADGKICRVNGDPGALALPLGIRWVVDRYSNGTTSSATRAAARDVR
jgi:hypothetical protein